MKLIAKPGLRSRDGNPYNYLLYSHMEKHGCSVGEELSISSLRASSVYHIHWPEAFLNSKGVLSALLRAAKLMLTVFLVKLYRLKLVWTVHNLKPHEDFHPRLKAVFYSVFPRVCDGFIFLSEFTRGASKKTIPSIDHAKSVTIYHGHYRPVLGDVPTKKEARRLCGIKDDEQVYIYFGLVRRYKNVPLLINEFSKVGGGAKRLVVLGRVVNDQTLESEIRGLAGLDPRVTLKLEHIPEKELVAYLAASDVVVLPFSDVANSGSVMMALSVGRKVIAPNKGSLKELQNAVGDTWLQLYDGDFSAEKLIRANCESKDGLFPDLSSYDWSGLARQSIDFFKTL